MGIHQRFFAALALSDLVNERSLDFVGAKFGLNKGTLQSLQTQASTFAGKALIHERELFLINF